MKSGLNCPSRDSPVFILLLGVEVHAKITPLLNPGGGCVFQVTRIYLINSVAHLGSALVNDAIS